MVCHFMAKYSILHVTMRYGGIGWTMVWYCLVSYTVEQCGMTWYSKVWYGIWHYIIRYGVV